MGTFFSRRSLVASAPSQSGVTLVEVLVGIFITGIALLALLALFPVGALEMARAIKDDRAEQIAAEAAAFSQAAERVVLRTGDFVETSLLSQKIDRNPGAPPRVTASITRSPAPRRNTCRASALK